MKPEVNANHSSTCWDHGKVNKSLRGERWGKLLKSGEKVTAGVTPNQMTYIWDSDICTGQMYSQKTIGVKPCIMFLPNVLPCTNTSTQNQKAVFAYLTSKHILPFGFAGADYSIAGYVSSTGSAVIMMFVFALLSLTKHCLRNFQLQLF